MKVCFFIDKLYRKYSIDKITQGKFATMYHYENEFHIFHMIISFEDKDKYKNFK